MSKFSPLYTHCGHLKCNLLYSDRENAVRVFCVDELDTYVHICIYIYLFRPPPYKTIF